MAPTLSISIAHASLRERAELAKKADEAGMATIWTEDGDAFVILAYLAQHVRRARLGSGVARAFVRSAMTTAVASANLQEITDGRFVLGMGSGTKGQNVQQLGQEFDHPASRVGELCTLLRQMWSNTGQPLKFSGQFYDVSFDGPTLDRMRCASPPIFLAAVNDFMLRTAGRSCDGLAGHPCFSAPYLRDVVEPKIQQGLDDRKRDRKAFQLSSWVITSIDEDRAMARRRAAYQIGYYFSTKSYGSLLEWHGFTGVQSRIRTALFEHRNWEEVADCISDEMVDMFSVAGTANDCIDKIKRYDGILDDIVLYSHAAGPARENAGENLQKIIKAFG